MQPTKTEIKSGLALPAINVSFTQNDKPEAYIRYAGYNFPVIQLNNTVLNAQDIMSCIYRIGYESLPSLRLSINDALSGFRDSDVIDKDSIIVMYIGSQAVSEYFCKQVFKVDSVVSAHGFVNITATMQMPSLSIDVYAGSITDMLKDLCSKTKLGLRYNHGIDYSFADNYVNMQPIDIINAITSKLNMSWFIDNFNNLVLLDIKQTISEHKITYTDSVIVSGEQLPEKQRIYLNNKLSEESQFKFKTRSFDFNDIDNSKPNVESLEFDKSSKPALDKLVAAETEPAVFAAAYDTSTVFMTIGYNPYVMPFQTYDVEVYTNAGLPKRQTMENYESGNAVDERQQLIQDHSGVFLLTKWEYRFLRTEPELWVTLARPV